MGVLQALLPALDQELAVAASHAATRAKVSKTQVWWRAAFSYSAACVTRAALQTRLQEALSAARTVIAELTTLLRGRISTVLSLMFDRFAGQVHENLSLATRLQQARGTLVVVARVRPVNDEEAAASGGGAVDVLSESELVGRAAVDRARSWLRQPRPRNCCRGGVTLDRRRGAPSHLTVFWARR